MKSIFFLLGFLLFVVCLIGGQMVLPFTPHPRINRLLNWQLGYNLGQWAIAPEITLVFQLNPALWEWAHAAPAGYWGYELYCGPLFFRITYDTAQPFMKNVVAFFNLGPVTDSSRRVLRP